MSWMRCVVIAKSASTDFNTKFADCKHKVLFENNGYSMVVIEGREFPRGEMADACVLGVDGRNPAYFRIGDAKLAEAFKCYIELTIGVAYANVEIPPQAIALREIMLGEFGAYEDLDEEANMIVLRFDVREEALGDIRKLVLEFAQILDGQNIEHAAATFESGSGSFQGNTQYEDLFFGPASYVFGTWQAEEMHELVLNQTECLIDDNDVPEFR